MRNTLLAALVALALPAAAGAATVTFNLAVNPTAGTYTVTLADSTEANNFGVAAYAFTLSKFSTLVNASPYTVFYDNVSGDEVAQAGFNETRTSSGVNPSGAGQAVSAGDVRFVYGIGQTAGTLATYAPVNSTPTPANRLVYTAPLVVATGTYTGTAPTLTNVSANYFSTMPAGNARPVVPQATAVATTTTVPEPAALGLVGLLAGGTLVRRRRA